MSNSLTQVSTQPLVENFATLTCSSSTKDDPWGWLVSISTHQPMPVLTPGGDGPYPRQENEGIRECVSVQNSPGCVRRNLQPSCLSYCSLAQDYPGGQPYLETLLNINSYRE